MWNQMNNTQSMENIQIKKVDEEMKEVDFVEIEPLKVPLSKLQALM